MVSQEIVAFINVLRATRLAWGLSVSDLAEILDINKRVLYAWETLEYSPTVDNLFRWARALGLDISATMRK